MSLCVKASEIASSEVPACLARVAPVCLNLWGDACSRFWDKGVARDTETLAKAFLTQIEQLGESLVKASGSFKTIDTESAEEFKIHIEDVLEARYREK